MLLAKLVVFASRVASRPSLCLVRHDRPPECHGVTHLHLARERQACGLGTLAPLHAPPPTRPHGQHARYTCVSSSRVPSSTTRSQPRNAPPWHPHCNPVAPPSPPSPTIGARHPPLAASATLNRSVTWPPTDICTTCIISSTRILAVKGVPHIFNSLKPGARYASARSVCARASYSRPMYLPDPLPASLRFNHPHAPKQLCTTNFPAHDALHYLVAHQETIISNSGAIGVPKQLPCFFFLLNLLLHKLHTTLTIDTQVHMCFIAPDNACNSRSYSCLQKHGAPQISLRFVSSPQTTGPAVAAPAPLDQRSGARITCRTPAASLTPPERSSKQFLEGECIGRLTGRSTRPHPVFSRRLPLSPDFSLRTRPWR